MIRRKIFLKKLMRRRKILLKKRNKDTQREVVPLPIKQKNPQQMDTNKTRILFKDFWPGFNSRDNPFCELLTKYGYNYEVVDTNPDIIIFSVFGSYYRRLSVNNIDTNIRRVFYTGENCRAIKNADLNLTFDNSSNYNNIRLPLWLLEFNPDKDTQLTKKEASGFCCFVASNPATRTSNRLEFCKKLSRYKRVDCGGGCLNNVGGKVSDKIAFQKKYKFCIAYENSEHPGYTTEKILDAYMSNCIPIYYGSTTITDDFNPETFINAHNFNSEDELIEYIKKVDTDNNLYNSFMNKPIYSKEWLKRFNDPQESHFKNIAQQIMGKNR